MKLIALSAACAILTIPTAASASDFQDCSNSAYDKWHNQLAFCQSQYENGYFGVAGQIERDRCMQEAYDNYGYEMDICRQFYPEGISYIPQTRYLPSKSVDLFV